MTFGGVQYECAAGNEQSAKKKAAYKAISNLSDGIHIIYLIIYTSDEIIVLFVY